MSYVDKSYYQDMFKGSAIPDEYLEKQLERASDHIDIMTYSRIQAKGFDSLTLFQQTRVKKAVCYHAEFIYQYGAYLDIPLSGYSAGSVSLSFQAAESRGIKTSQDVIDLLQSTGLTSRRL